MTTRTNAGGKARVLVVEDDWEIAGFVASTLQKHGYDTCIASDRDSTLRAFEATIPDLVILDVMLPGEDGFRILGRIRQRHSVPVIMLTALAEPDQRVQGLRQGADDYVSKPFNTDELVARVEAILRRSAPVEDDVECDQYLFEGWSVDARKRLVQDPSGVTVLLTSGEFDVLRVLCKNAGVIMGRDRIVHQSQNRMVEPYDRSIDTLVSRIRRKLQRNGTSDNFIKTVRGEGYIFTPAVRRIVR